MPTVLLCRGVSVTTREVSYNLAGTVRNQSLPIAGTTIVIYDYWSTGAGLIRHYVSECVTGSRGDFSFDVRKGIYGIEVVPNRETRFARQSIDTIKVTTNTTLTIGLRNGCGLSGSIRTTDGSTVESAELLFFGIEPEVLRASELGGDDGSFSITLPKGKYYVACRFHPDSVRKSVSEVFLCPTMLFFELTGDAKQDITLPELVAFKGLVTNPEGHPVPEVRVTIRASQNTDNIYANEANLVATCHTNKLGQFICNVEPGTYDVKLEPGPESHLSERAVTSILVDQGRTRNYALGAGYKLTGNVTFEGRPVENALVTVYGGKIDSSVLTDQDGNYTFALSGGSYELSVAAQPDSLARLPFRLLAPYTCSISLTEDTSQDVGLQQGVAINGKVTDEAGKPRPGVQLALYPDKGEPIATTGRVHRALAFGITGDDGSYEFRVAPGRYWLVINNQQSTAQLLEANEDDLQSDLTWQAGCIVEFEVVSENEEPIPNCQVFCDPYGGIGLSNEPIQTVSDDEGICRLSMPAGIYAFRFEPPEHGSFQNKNIRQFSINSDVHRKVKLGAKSMSASSTADSE